MIEIILVINYTPENPQLPLNYLDELEKKIYLPVIEVIKAESIPAVHCISAQSLLKFSENKSQSFFKNIHRLLKDDQGEIATKGFTDVAFTHLSTKEIQKHLELIREIEDEIGIRSYGFTPVEGIIDPLTIYLLEEKEFKWVMLPGKSIIGNYGQVQSTAYEPKIQMGLEEKKLPVFCGFDTKQNNFQQKLKEVIFGKADTKKFVNEIFQATKDYREQRCVFCIEFSMETAIFTQNPVIQKFRFFLQSLQSIGGINFTLPGNVLERTDVTDVVYSKGNLRRLPSLIAEAREEILSLEKENPNHPLLKSAWKELFSAQNYHVQEATKYNMKSAKYFYNHYLKACNQAFNCKNLNQDG